MSRRLASRAAALAVVAAAAACGLPDEGTRQVPDDQVPYRLLEDGERSASVTGRIDPPDPTAPMVFWVDDDDRLAPASAPASCEDAAEEQVEALLTSLADGPDERVRAAGRTSAWVPLVDLSLVAVEGRTAVVDVDADDGSTADRLPLAIGQVTLTVSTAQGVDAVAFVDDAGERLQVPLPGGALTEEPVTPGDYGSLLAGSGPDRAASWPGCG